MNGVGNVQLAYLAAHGNSFALAFQNFSLLNQRQFNRNFHYIDVMLGDGLLYKTGHTEFTILIIVKPLTD